MTLTRSLGAVTYRRSDDTEDHDVHPRDSTAANETTPNMPTPTHPLFVRFTVRKTVRLVTTLEVYAAPTPPRPTITVEGVDVTDELPASQPSIRKARPVAVTDNVVAFPVRRTASR